MNGDKKRLTRLLIELVVGIVVVVLIAIFFGPIMTVVVAILMILGISWDFTHPNSRRLDETPEISDK